MAPERVGRFRFIRKLANGCLGEVWYGEEELAPSRVRPVVLECLHPALVNMDDDLERFRQDAERAARVHHENLVEIYSFVETREATFLAREYVAGQSLSAVFDRAQKFGKWPPYIFGIWLAARICRALEYAENLRLNLHPNHVLLSYRGELKLTGLRRRPPSDPDKVAGPPPQVFAYMSPEEVLGHALDARSEVFKIGRLLWELSTTRRPFEGMRSLDVITAVIETRFARPSEIDPQIPLDLEAIIVRAIKRRREERYQTLAEIRLELESLLKRSYGAGEVAAYLQELFDAERRAEAQPAERSAPDEEREAFEAKITRTPAEPAPYLVYADWLQQKEDPRGELIVLDHALSGAGHVVGFDLGRLRRDLRRATLDAAGREMLRRERGLLQSAAARLLDGLPAGSGIVRRAVWRYGFIAGVAMFLGENMLAAREVIAALAASASGRFLRVLRLELDDGVELQEDLGFSRLSALECVEVRCDHPLPHALERAPAFRGLDRLTIRSAHPGHEEESGPTEPVRPVFPA